VKLTCGVSFWKSGIQEKGRVAVPKAAWVDADHKTAHLGRGEDGLWRPVEFKILGEMWAEKGASMKVVLFCGGAGMRLRGYTDDVPKPMVTIGSRPVLWHVMKYYAHFGHKNFILCLGYKANVIKNYFLDYQESVSNDFVFSQGGKKLDFMQRDIDDWTITFVDTGLQSTIADRLRLSEPHLQGEEIFLANYSDGLTDFHLPELIEEFSHRDAYASFLTVQPRSSSLDTVHMDKDGSVQAIKCMKESNIWVNGGYFVLRKEVFRYIKPKEELVYEPFSRMISEGRVWSKKYTGFWQCMDTFRDKQILDELEASGEAPWYLWKNGRSARLVVA
jgi:glucose-1-phosphate cytidylyltransferase